jgi:hypothetical protein
MILTILYTLASLVFELDLSNTRPDPATDPEPWKLVKNAEGVQTYFRWTTDDAGKTFRERKGEMRVKCSMEEAIQLIADAKSTSKWMSGIEENYELKKVNQHEWYTYTLFSIPWPFSKRDLVSYYKISRNPALHNVTIDILCRDNYIPLKSKITRLTSYQAIWRIAQQSQGIIQISFTAGSSAPPAFPRYIQDPVIEKMFHNNLIRFKEIVEQ